MKIANQHGDVILELVDSLPEGAVKIEIQNGFVLERGEGVHTHVFPDVEGIEVFEKDGQTYVCVTRLKPLDHEEHGLQPVKIGIYKKRLEQVWDYIAQESRKVID